VHDRSNATLRALARASAALITLATNAACERSEAARCSLGQATQVVRSEAARFDAIALVSDGERAIAAWSEPAGAYVRALDAKAPPARALGQRCAGGLASVLTPGALWVACLSPAEGDTAGALRLSRFDPRTLVAVGATQDLGAVGRDAQQVALAASPSRLYVVWSDGAVGWPRLVGRELDAASGQVLGPAHALSHPEANARAPSLLVYQNQLWVAWTESDFKPGKARHRLMLQRGSAAAQALADVLDETPAPALGQDADGPLLTFRTATKPKARPELFVARLDPRSGGFTATPRSIGRANGAGGPSLALCATTRAISVPIDHAGELYVAFHPLSQALTSTEENHQYYESGRELVAAASACVGGYPLTLMAEQSEPSRPRARLLSTAFRCDR
jgi:hypothetical protein